tara:strand:+ start:7572 stop:7742 length:171 start_codon:yes stop_codon:yes gene_type:complete
MSRAVSVNAQGLMEDAEALTNEELQAELEDMEGRKWSAWEEACTNEWDDREQRGCV